MGESPRHSENAWLSARPKLRSDLLFAPRASRGKQGYIVEDPVRGKFYRLGIAEYALVAALDGRTTVGEALERASAAVPHPLTQESAIALVSWSASIGLLEQKAGAATGEKTAPQRPAWWQNPIFIRIPLIAPDRLLDRLEPYFGWVGAAPMVVVTLVLATISGLALAPESKLLFDSLHSVFSPAGGAGLLASWVVLKVIHEMGHGLICRRYGASAREAGIMLLLFLPIPYIDVTSSWRLRDRRHRIHIAAGGMLVELAIASIAGFVWLATSPGPLHQLAANVVIMASITTILFNANPLMRFDGYYILSDLLDVPNLYGQGQLWLRSWLRRWFLGIATPAPALPYRLAAFMRGFAIAAFFWRMLVYAGIILAAALLWQGAGIVLSAFAMVTWFAIPIVRWVRTTFITPPPNAPRPSWSRLTAVVGGSLAVATGFAWGVPWPGASAAPAVVDYAPLWVLRAPTNGWIDQLFVESGQRVATGQVLAVLRNDGVDLELARLDVEIHRAELAIRRFEQERKTAAAQAEVERRIGLEKQRAELAEQHGLLSIRAPADGYVVSPRVSERLGMYLRQGEELLHVADERRKEVRLAATQDEINRLSHRVGQSVRVRLAEGESIAGRLERVKPRASTRPLHPALTATAGGPLTVQRTAADRRTGAADDVQLLQPHFEAVVPLPPDAAARLRAGQTVTVYLDAGRDSVGEHLFKAAREWFRARTQ